MDDNVDPASPGLTDAHHDWMRDTMGVDPRSYGAAPDGAAPADPTPGAAPGGAPEPAPAAPAAPPPVSTPDDARADLERRLKASKATYDQYGPEAADKMVKPEDRLTPAELRLGTMGTETATSTTVDDKSVTRQTTTTTAGATLGDDGKPVDFVHKDSRTATVGLATGTASVTDSTTATLTTGSGSTKISDQTSIGIDLDKGVVGGSTTSALEQTSTTSGTTVKTTSSTTTTFNTSGIGTSTTSSTQTGNELDSRTVSGGLQRSEGQLGFGGGATFKSGTMEGPADKQTMVKGNETNVTGGGGIVSDDKGTGLGLNVGGSSKETLRPGVSLTDTFSAGGRCQSLVKEVPGSDPPTFTITTTISFNVSLGTSLGGESAPKATPDESGKDRSDGKVSASAGVSVGFVTSASFTQQLPDDQAKKYLEDIANNGRGGSFPEHQVLATGMSQGWEAAANLYKSLVGDATFAKSLKAGQQIETSKGDTEGVQIAAGAETGGVTLGVQGGATASHKVTFNEKGLGDDKLQVTATIEDSSSISAGASVGVGLAGGQAGMTHGEGKARVVVMVLNQKDPNFSDLLGQIRAADTPEALDKITAAHPELLSQTTSKTSSSDGGSAGMNIGAAKVTLGGTGTLSEEQTRDKDGNIIGSKAAGASQSGGSVGIGDLKYTEQHTEGYTGEVDAAGHATGEIDETDKTTSLSKTVGNLGKIASDPLGTLMHPTSLIGTETKSQGTDLADPEVMRYVNEALDAAGWNKKVVGMNHDDWVACGNKIRAAVTVTNGEITAVNKHAVQAALAEWSKTDVAGRNEPLTAIVRPKDGPVMGKAYAWPDGTDRFQPQWKALVVGDPTADATTKLKAGQFPEAVAAFKAALDSVQSFSNQLNTAQNVWHDADKDGEFAEMMGLINTRITDITKALHDAEKKARPEHAPAHGLPGQPNVAGPPTAAQQEELDKEQQAKDAAEDANKQFKADLDVYNNNIEQMQRYAESVFKECGETEAYLNASHMFENKIAEAIKMLQRPAQTLKLWDPLYWRTFALYQKYADRGLDKSRVEKLHPAGAQGAWNRIDKMTRDPGMA